MDATVMKKTKSIKNAEKRRERSKVAARCRRGKESEIFNDISACLPVPENARSGLDKASVMRLALCDLKLKKMMESVFPAHEDVYGSNNADFDSHISNAIGGFVLIMTLNGDVVYVSEGITTQLGISQYEIMGQSIYGFSCESDHHDLQGLLAVKKGEEENDGTYQRAGLFRMKNTVTGRGRNAHLRSINYKVINCVGRIFTGNEDDPSKQWFVGVCEPLLHPSDVDIPLNKQSFLSKHTPDMKFEYVDESVSAIMGYKPEEMLGKSLFEFHHAADGQGIAKTFKSLYDKTQNLTDRYRFLTKGGGWVWIITQATIIPSENSSKVPNSVVCIHFITSGMEEDNVILSEVQMGEFAPAPVPDREPVAVDVPVSRTVLSEKKVNIKSPSETKVRHIPMVDLSNLYTAEENDFICDLLSGPLLNNATCSTSKIFAPRTEDMNTGFLMPVDDTLIVSKEEPEDLTHLAPIAGDECVPLDVPLLEDLLASLNEADMEYSFINPDSDEAREFGVDGIPLQPYGLSYSGKRDAITVPMEERSMHEPPSPVNNSMLRQVYDPPMVNSPGSASSLLSPYRETDSPSSRSLHDNNSALMSPVTPLTSVDDPIFSGRPIIDGTPPPIICNGLDTGPIFSAVPNFSPVSPVHSPRNSLPSVADLGRSAAMDPGGTNWNCNPTMRNNPQINVKKEITEIGESGVIFSTSGIESDGPPDRGRSFSLPNIEAQRLSLYEHTRRLQEGQHHYTLETRGRGESSKTKDLGPTPSKMTKLVPLSSVGFTRDGRGNNNSGSGCGPSKIYILVPVTKRRSSLQSSGSGSDSESSRGPITMDLIEPEYNRKEFDEILSTIGLEVDRNSPYVNSVDFSRPRAEACPKRVRKRNYAGTLLSDGPLSLHALTRQDCEVNAPLSQAAKLLQGPELLNALETGLSTEANIL